MVLPFDQKTKMDTPMIMAEAAYRCIHSDINLLRELASGSRVLGILIYCHAYSSACAPGFPNASPLATISVAMYKKTFINWKG